MIADHHHQRTPTSFEPQSLISISNAQEGLDHHRRCHTPTKCVVPASAGYSGNYGNPEAGYAANPYQASYGGNPMNPAGAENYPPYGPGPGSWGAYDMQRAQGQR
ncbi:hypothetical protein RHGRI_036167 [Rhododendron griersonianum]|uniref:Uncharacterized protein n=1 Tax=Rhododendron griersonianum TaxID=479676 RepID=A0AAV6HMG6_9ERIC|nr:hypothetical protein RHGRI_036167 [Rhododendron griersonianum]